MSKVAYLITCGNSLLTNYQKSPSPDPRVMGLQEDDARWEELLNDEKFYYTLLSFAEKVGRKSCAEINVFESFYDQSSKSEVFLAGTKTISNNIVVRTLEIYFKKQKGIVLGNTKEYEGYFDTPEPHRKEAFEKELADLMMTFLAIISKKQKQNYNVYVLPVGGFKAHVIAAAMAGFLCNANVGYIHEKFEQPILFPGIFSIPNKDEYDVLKFIEDHQNRVSSDQIQTNFADCEKTLEKLEILGFLEFDQGYWGLTTWGKRFLRRR